MGFTEDIGKVMVVLGGTRHVNWSIVRGGFVREEKLADLSIVYLRETGESCSIDKRNFQSNERGQSRQRFG